MGTAGGTAVLRSEQRACHMLPCQGQSKLRYFLQYVNKGESEGKIAEERQNIE